MLSEKQIAQLRASFPVEALSADTSRGFELTSIKAAYVVERLNEVFGPCGCGWRYAHSPFEWIEGEVLTEVAMQFKVAEGGVAAMLWDAQAHRWTTLNDSEDWSLPIFSPGGRKPGRGSAPMTDARKGAITDGLTKAASMIGVGHDVFKGKVRVGDAKPASQSNGNGFEPRPQPVNPRRAIPAKDKADSTPTNGTPPVNGTPNSNGAANGSDGGSTAYWLYANSDAARTVDRSTASALAKQVIDGKSTWDEALAKLKAMAEGTATTQTLRVMDSSDPLDLLFK